MAQQIMLKQVNKPFRNDLHTDIEWVCESFGLCSGRDLDRISTQIVQGVLTHHYDSVLSSQMLAEELDIALGRVHHHLRHLMETGLLYREKRQIVLRGGSLKMAVRELRQDAERIFSEIEYIAEKIDKELGVKGR